MRRGSPSRSFAFPLMLIVIRSIVKMKFLYELILHMCLCFLFRMKMELKLSIEFGIPSVPNWLQLFLVVLIIFGL